MTYLTIEIVQLLSDNRHQTTAMSTQSNDKEDEQHKPLYSNSLFFFSVACGRVLSYLLLGFSISHRISSTWAKILIDSGSIAALAASDSASDFLPHPKEDCERGSVSATAVACIFSLPNNRCSVFRYDSAPAYQGLSNEKDWERQKSYCCSQSTPSVCSI